MPIPNVCAVVVTFHPKAETLTNLGLLAAQVGELVVVDNGSCGAPLEMLRRANRTAGPDAAYARGLHLSGYVLIENGANLGIAAALNIGVRWALERGFEWVTLFDQDSTVTAGFMVAMLDGHAKHPRPETVAIFCPEYVDRESGEPVSTTGLDAAGAPVVAMTSGSLMPAWCFARCGWFLEDLFMDQVDVEYCFRVRSLGYAIARGDGASLLHAAGAPRVHRLMGLRLFRATHHSAARRYYITRNRVWVLMKYRKLYLKWCLTMVWSIVADTIKVAFAEDSKSAKMRDTLRGVVDGLRGRLGKTRDI